MQTVSFLDIPMEESIHAAIKRQGYTEPTPVQAQSIPILLNGEDLIGTAQTGTGKTAAFVLPMLDRLLKNRRGNQPNGRAAQPRALILAPTRELAVQIGDSVNSYRGNGKISSATVFGGAPKPGQAAKLRSKPEILVATPGRLMDFISEGRINLKNTEILILDEADRMLDMGFIPDIRKIASMAAKRSQTVLFSATMPPAIEKLSMELLQNPKRVSIAPEEITTERILQSVLHMQKEDKVKLLPEIIQEKNMYKVIVFTKTKHRAAKLATLLSKNSIPSDAIHGDRSQSQRQRALDKFRQGKIQALIATDVAARGIDVDDITHVINYEIPHEAESYIHRIGRTARAGNEGIAIAFCDRDEIKDFRAIEKLIGKPISIDTSHEYHTEMPVNNGRGSRKAGGRSRGKRPSRRRRYAG